MYNGFELCEGRPDAKKKEYADSEKYELTAWDWDRPGNIISEITALNRIRRDNPALQSHLGLTFLRRLERQRPLLREGDARPRQCRSGRDQPRPAPSAGGRHRDPALAVRPSRRCHARGRGSDAGHTLHLVRQDPAHPPRSCRPALLHLAARPPGGLLTMAKSEPSLIDDDPLWYKDAVIYQLHVKSFFDANNDGIGDFAGLASPSSTISPALASTRFGCCRSTRRRARMTATTSRAIAMSAPTTARSPSSRPSSARRMRAAFGSSPSW